MAFDLSFLNVFEGVLATASAESDALHAAIAALDTSPRTIWIARTVTLAGIFDVPRSAILSFAPGARLILDDGARFTLWGFLDAGLETCFELRDGASLALLGPLEEIVADWWAMTGGVSPVARALDALWTRYQHAGEGVLPAPIRLDGPYGLNETLRVVPPDGFGRIEVILRGSHGRPSDPPTFVRGPLALDLLSLVSIEKGVVLTMEHVAFDLDPTTREGRDSPASGVGACLSLEEEFSGSRVEACAFRFDGDAIQVAPRVQYWQEQITRVGLSAGLAGALALGDAVRLSVFKPARLAVSRCVFTGTSPHARGIVTELGIPTSLAVRDSQFVGRYANAISVLGGDVDLVGCQFANTLSTSESRTLPADVITRSWDAGVDINEVGKNINGVLPERLVRNIPSGFNIYQGRPLANTHLTITHCVSTSAIFLILNPAFSSADTIAGGAVLTAVRHFPAVDGGPSVMVGRLAEPRSVMMQGCRFGRSVTFDPSTLVGVVVDLGTVFVPPPGTTAGFLFAGVGVGPTVTMTDF